MITYRKDDPLESFLRVEKLEPNPQVAHLLPSEVAKQWHALPIAQEGQVITVAMANPADTQAKAAVRATLGRNVCFVQADSGTIDEKISAIWPNTPANPISIIFLGGRGFEEYGCAEYLTRLCKAINARYTRVVLESRKALEQVQDIQQENPCDLLVYLRPTASRRTVNPTWERKFFLKAPVSVLMLQSMRWPIKSVLLFVQSLDLDENTLAWAVFFGCSLGVAVTVVPLLPVLPAIYAHDPDVAYNIPALLKSDCRLGKRLRMICKTLDVYNLSGTLALQSVSPARRRLCQQHDLVLLAGSVRAGVQKTYYHDVVQKFLRVEGANLLVSKGCPFSDILTASFGGEAV